MCTQWCLVFHRRLSLKCIYRRTQLEAHLGINTGPVMGFPLFDLIVYYVDYSFAAFKMHNSEQYILLSLHSMFKRIHHYFTGRNSGNFVIYTNEVGSLLSEEASPIVLWSTNTFKIWCVSIILVQFEGGTWIFHKRKHIQCCDFCRSEFGI